MKSLLIILLLFACCIVPVTAYGEYNGNVSAPHWFNTSSSEASAVCVAHGKTYTGDYIGVSMYWSDLTHESHIGGSADYDIYAASFSANTSWIYHYVTCNVSSYTIKYYSTGTYVIPPVADFNATPVSGVAPTYVSLKDNSTGYGISTWNWSISPATGWFASSGDLNTRDLTLYFTENGNYSVTHGVSSTGGSDTETKTNYIWIHNLTETVTTPFTVVDLAFGHTIQGASVSLKDVENSSWTNTTSTGPYGNAYITTLIGHHINGYASATGYEDADLIGADATTNGHWFYMYPANYTSVSAGNVTVFVNVVDDTNYGTVIPGASVTGLLGSAVQLGTTDTSGIVKFVYPNNSIVHFSATKAGYAGTTITLNTGTGNGGSASVTGTIHMFKGAVTSVPTGTTVPGATTITTVDPYPCDADHPENCQRKQTEMGNTLVAWGPDLLLFFIMLTIVGGVKLIGRK